MSPRTEARIGNSGAIAALMAREHVCVVTTYKRRSISLGSPPSLRLASA